MRWTALILMTASAAIAQSTAKPATAPASKASKPAATATKSTTATPASTAKKPASDMPLLRGIIKPMFSERYEDIKVGTGALAEPNKMYHVHYSGYLATTGQKFDSSYDHRVPLMKDGKPVTGDDGKPQLGDPQPMVFPQGMGRLIPGFDQGFAGMHVGGKRRIFIPYQLAYGTREIPPRAGSIGIPAKSDLIFDVELLDVSEIPTAPAQPFGGGVPRPQPPPTPGAQPATPPPASSAPATQPQTSAPSAQPATPPPATTTEPK